MLRCQWQRPPARPPATGRAPCSPRPETLPKQTEGRSLRRGGRIQEILLPHLLAKGVGAVASKVFSGRSRPPPSFCQVARSNEKRGAHDPGSPQAPTEPRALHPTKQLREAPSRSTRTQQPVRNMRIWKLPAALCQSQRSRKILTPYSAATLRVLKGSLARSLSGAACAVSRDAFSFPGMHSGCIHCWFAVRLRGQHRRRWLSWRFRDSVP